MTTVFAIPQPRHAEPANRACEGRRVDGKPYKTLKRHMSTHAMSVAQYLEKFGLPKN
jgi:hypothetical protein